MHEWCLPRVHITCIQDLSHPSCLRHGTGRRLDVSRFLVLCVAVRGSLERTLDASRLLRTRTRSTLFLQDIQESYKIIQDIQICCARYTDMPFEATFDWLRRVFVLDFRIFLSKDIPMASHSQIAIPSRGPHGAWHSATGDVHLLGFVCFGSCTWTMNFTDRLRCAIGLVRFSWMENVPKWKDDLLNVEGYFRYKKSMNERSMSFTKVFPSHAAVLFWVFGVATFGALAKWDARNAMFSLSFLSVAYLFLSSICLSCGPNSHHERCYVGCKWTRCSNLHIAQISSKILYKYSLHANSLMNNKYTSNKQYKPIKWRDVKSMKSLERCSKTDILRSVNHGHVFIVVYLRGVAFGVLSPCFASLICSRAPKELQGQVFGLAIVVTWHLVPTPYAHRGAFYCGSVWWDLCTSCLWSLKSPAWFTRQFKMSDFKHEGLDRKCVNQIQEKVSTSTSTARFFFEVGTLLGMPLGPLWSQVQNTPFRLSELSVIFHQMHV